MFEGSDRTLNIFPVSLQDGVGLVLIYIQRFCSFTGMRHID